MPFQEAYQFRDRFRNGVLAALPSRECDWMDADLARQLHLCQPKPLSMPAELFV
jgi:hypothetical protein